MTTGARRSWGRRNVLGAAVLGTAALSAGGAAAGHGGRGRPHRRRIRGRRRARSPRRAAPGPPAAARSRGHRPPRRQRLPPGTHHGLLPAGPRHGRRRHRAGPRAHEGRAPGVPPRERHHGHDGRRGPPRVRLAPHHQDRRRAGAHRLVHGGLHARRAEDAPRQGAHRARGRTTPSTTAGGPCRPSTRCCAGPRRRAAAGAVRVAARRDQAPHLLPQARPGPGGAAGPAAAPVRPPPRRLPDVPPVLRAQQHGARWRGWSARPAWCCSGRPTTGPGTSSRQATRVPSRTSSHPRAWTGSPRTRRASARSWTWSCPATPRAAWARPPPSSATPTPAGWSSTRTPCAARTASCPPTSGAGRTRTRTATSSRVPGVLRHRHRRHLHRPAGRRTAGRRRPPGPPRVAPTPRCGTAPPRPGPPAAGGADVLVAHARAGAAPPGARLPSPRRRPRPAVAGRIRGGRTRGPFFRAAPTSGGRQPHARGSPIGDWARTRQPSAPRRVSCPA